MKTYSVGPQKERFIEISCNFCNSKRSTPLLVEKGFRFIKCSQCGLVYQNPQPVFNDLRKRYRGNYFKYELDNERNFFHLMKLGLEDIHFDQLTDGLSNGARFLDIGCATGMLLSFMREKGWKVQGVELCRESAGYAIKRKNLDVFIGPLHEAAFPESSFSVIHFSHLIEHVPDPKGFITEVRRILAPHGLAVITTPNINGFQARLFKERWRSAIADHLTLFSKDTLKHLLEESGFKVLMKKTWGGLAKGTAPLLIKRPMDILAKRYGFGDVMLFLASKEP